MVRLFGPETLRELNGKEADREEYEAVLEEWKREFTKVRDYTSIAHNSNLMVMVM